jgi:hypothetical protein
LFWLALYHLAKFLQGIYFGSAHHANLIRMQVSKMAKELEQNSSKLVVEDEEDDYMSMAIVEPTKPYEKETYTQRRIRKQREVISHLLFACH